MTYTIKQLNALIKRIEEEAPEYVEESEFSYKFSAKVFEVFREVLFAADDLSDHFDECDDPVLHIIEHGFDDDIIDMFVDTWEKS